MVLLAAALAGPDELYVQAARVGFTGGFGGSWLLGGNGAGYAPGPTERLGIEGRFGTANAGAVRLRHAHHVLDDADAYFDGVPTNPDTLAGGRDYVLVDLSVRVGLDLVEETALPAARVRGYPYARVGAGAGFARTRLDTASFTGRTELQSRSVLPMFVADLGVEIRFLRAVSVFPAIAVTALLAEDVGEMDGRARWGFETHLEPGVDVSVGF